MEITPTNLIIPLPRDDGSEVSVWVPQPLEKEVLGISRILAYLHKEMAGTSLNAVIIDWERYVEESLLPLPNQAADSVREKLNVFFERASSGATLADGDFNSLSDNEKHLFKGALLFICALYRYFSKMVLKSDAAAFFTSSNAMEWKQSLQKSAKESMEPQSTQPTAGVSVKQ